jgi:hypothetical protein
MKASTPPLFQQRHLLGVAQISVGFVFDDAGICDDHGVVQARHRVGTQLAALVDLGDNGWCGLNV